MTAISPLQSIHKKGIFGDHHKKNQSDLLQISEVKDLTIIQVAQYKRSKIKIDSVLVNDLKFSAESSKVVCNRDTRILWIAPRSWLIVSSKENITDDIKKNCSNEDFSITDISHSRAVIQISGMQAVEVLKKGCPINFNEFKINNCAGTVFNGITILVDFVDNKPEKLHLLTLRSFGESFYHHITDAALEFGYVGI